MQIRMLVIIKRFLLLCIAVFIMDDLISSFRPDKTIKSAMVAMSSNSRFKVDTGSKYDFQDLPVTGVLGPFYQCLKAYRVIGMHRREQKGEYRVLFLHIDNETILWIDLYGQEAHSFQVVAVEGDHNKRSRLYSLNCDVALLSQSANK